MGRLMNLQQIIEAVNSGLTVHWKNSNYIVVPNGKRYLIKCISNNSCVGLTWLDGIFEHSENDFFIGSN